VTHGSAAQGYLMDGVNLSKCHESAVAVEWRAHFRAKRDKKVSFMVKKCLALPVNALGGMLLQISSMSW